LGLSIVRRGRIFNLLAVRLLIGARADGVRLDLCLVLDFDHFALRAHARHVLVPPGHADVCALQMVQG